MVVSAMSFSEVFAAPSVTAGNSSLYPFMIDLYRYGWIGIVSTVTITSEPDGFWTVNADVSPKGVPDFEVITTVKVDWYDAAGNLMTTHQYPGLWYPEGPTSITNTYEPNATSYKVKIKIFIAYLNTNSEKAFLNVHTPSPYYRLETPIINT